MTRDNNRREGGSELSPGELLPLYMRDEPERKHWLTRGVCSVCGSSRSCPKRIKLGAVRAWKSLSRRLDVPGVRLNMLTVTTGRPGWDLAQRVEQLRKGVRALMQMRKLSGVSAIEWTQRPDGYHVHAHVVFLGANPWPPPIGWVQLRSDAVSSGLGSVAHIQPARAVGGLFAARYAMKYVAKSMGSPERSRLLRGRRLWNGHGDLSTWKGSPGAVCSSVRRAEDRREQVDGYASKCIRVQASKQHEDAAHDD